MAYKFVSNNEAHDLDICFKTSSQEQISMRMSDSTEKLTLEFEPLMDDEQSHTSSQTDVTDEYETEVSKPWHFCKQKTLHKMF